MMANRDSRHYIRRVLPLEIEILQSTKHDSEHTTLWLQSEIDLFKQRIGCNDGLVRVYHCV